MPFIAERFFRAPIGNPLPLKERVPKGVHYELKKLYYDTAQAVNVVNMQGLKRIVSASQIVFGTDFPWLTSAHHVKGITGSGVFSEAELRAIDGGNAVKILPQYAGR